MPKCLEPGCNVIIIGGARDAKVPAKCRKHRAARLGESTQEKFKTRAQVDAEVAFLTEKRETYLSAIAALEAHKLTLPDPVQVDARELEFLRNRSDVLGQLEFLVQPCLSMPHNTSDHPDAARRLLHWLKTSNVLLGRRF